MGSTRGYPLLYRISMGSQFDVVHRIILQLLPYVQQIPRCRKYLSSCRNHHSTLGYPRTTNDCRPQNRMERITKKHVYRWRYHSRSLSILCSIWWHCRHYKQLRLTMDITSASMAQRCYSRTTYCYD